MNSHISEREDEVDAATAALVVEMAVGEARRYEPAAEVDDAGAGADMGAHGVRRSDRDEASVLDGEGLRELGAGGGEDRAVDEDEVGRLGRGRRRSGERRDRAGDEGHAAAARADRHGAAHSGWKFMAMPLMQ